MLHTLLARLLAMFRRKRLDRDLTDELAFHLEMASAESGPDGRRAFGNVTRIQEDARQQWLFPAIEALVQDLGYGMRDLIRRPSFSISAISVLALGVGVNTAIFSIVNGLLLRPLPGVEEPHRLVEIARSDAGAGFETLSYPNFRDLESRADLLESAAAYESAQIPFDGGQGEHQLVAAQGVTEHYFDVLRPAMTLGRAVANSGEIVLSHGLWMRSLGADPAAIGRRVSIGGHPAVIAGVAGRRFCGVDCSDRTDVWIGLRAVRQGSELLSNRALNWLRVVARVRSNSTPETATTQLRSLGTLLAAEHPNENPQFGLAVNTHAGVDPKSRGSLVVYIRLVTWVTLLVLAAACTNVTGLLLARATARRQEIATRLAIGASRSRIVRQLITETLMLWNIAGIFGLALAWWGTDWVSRQPNFPPALTAFDLRPDANVLWFSLLLSAATGLVAGLAPAWNATRLELSTILKEDKRAGGGRLGGRDLLITAQLAVSLALVASSGLLIRSLSAMQGVRLGFETSGVWLAECSLSAPDASFGTRIVNQLRLMPGVTAASVVAVLPLRGRSMDGPVSIGSRRVQARFNMVGDGHFAALRIPVRTGREFAARDTSASAPVAIVNESFAKIYQVRAGDFVSAFPDNLRREIIGIVADHVYSRLRESVQPALYRPFAQQPVSQFSFEVRGPARGVFAASLTDNLRRLDNQAAIGQVTAMDDLYRAELWQSTVTTAFVTAFAVLALILSGVGLYGIVAYSAAQRRHEIAVRIALGARPADILKLFMRRMSLVLGVGLMAGIVLTIVTGGTLRSQLFGITPTDPAMLIGAALLLALVAAGSTLLPARRAALGDAAHALRDQ